jgi:hypothetical protein
MMSVNELSKKGGKKFKYNHTVKLRRHFINENKTQSRKVTKNHIPPGLLHSKNMNPSLAQD